MTTLESFFFNGFNVIYCQPTGGESYLCCYCLYFLLIPCFNIDF